MRVAIIGKKYNNNLSQFIEISVATLKTEGLSDKQIDLSYFDLPIVQDSNNLSDSFRDTQKIIFKTDALIINITERSEGIGFITGFATALNKPVLMLYDIEVKGSEKVVSTVLRSAEFINRVKVKDYLGSNPSTLSNHIKNFVLETKGLIDSKFYIILPSKITRYLEWWSYTYRKPKVEKIRSLLENDLDSNENYSKTVST